jgi:hypothetical protein
MIFDEEEVSKNDISASSINRSPTRMKRMITSKVKMG